MQSKRNFSIGIPSSFVLSGILALATSTAFAQAPVYSLIPQPAHMEQGQGEAVLSNETSVVYPAGDEAARFDAEHLAELAAKSPGLKLRPVAQGSAHGLAIKLVRTGNAVCGSLSAEGYSLTVAPEGVTISAASDAGLYYGTVTLWQMLTSVPKEKDAVHLKAVRIEDQPVLGWRGLMVDSARHMQSIAFLHQLVEEMSLEKLNTLHWHLTDDQGWRLEIKRYPKLTSVGAWRLLPGQKPGDKPYGGFYTQEQVRELVAFAQKRNVTIVPEIEMPGHATAAIAAYPEFGSTSHPPTSPSNHFGVLPSLYSPTQPAFTFLQNVLTEVMELFPSPYIHVGGDEAIKGEWKASPAIQAQMKRDGVANEDKLQSYFIQQMSLFLSAHGRRLVGWDEILDGGLAENAVVMSWHGVKGGEEAAKQGHDAVLSPATPLYFDSRVTDAPEEIAGRGSIHTLRDVYSFDPLPATLTKAQRAHIRGVQANTWTEYLLTDDRVSWMIFPRAAALAEIGWTQAEQRNWESFVSRMPAELARYKALGVTADPYVFRVQSKPSFSSVVARSGSVTLFNQANFGTLYYTTDGSAVTPGSPVYSAPIAVSLPAHLRAAAFVGATMVTGSEMDRQLTQQTIWQRTSEQLEPCVNDTLAMEHDPPQGDRTVLVVYHQKPCWIERHVPMDGVKKITVQMETLPWVFEDGAGNTPVLPRTANPGGELIVRIDGCSGKPIASMPLPLTSELGQTVTVETGTLSFHGDHDLCFETHRPTLDPLWALKSLNVVSQQVVDIDS